MVEAQAGRSQKANKQRFIITRTYHNDVYRGVLNIIQRGNFGSHFILYCLLCDPGTVERRERANEHVPLLYSSSQMLCLKKLLQLVGIEKRFFVMDKTNIVR